MTFLVIVDVLAAASSGRWFPFATRCHYCE